ncbi:MAG: TolC family protein, partial [Elusimicrobia bacterium]|nr:TolC family protein [Elusimicrobiota bacterium]
MSNFICSAMLLALGAVSLRAQPPLSERDLSLKDAVRLTLLNNTKLLSAEQSIIISQQRVYEARFLFLPQLGFQISGTKYNSKYPFALSNEFGGLLLFPDPVENLYSGMASVHLPLYTGRRTLNTLYLTQAALKQARAQYEAIKADAIYNTKRVFHQILFAQERARISEKRLQEAKQLFKNLKLSPWERLEGESVLNKLESEVSLSRHDLNLTRLEFLKSLNLELDTAIQIIGQLQADSSPIHLDQAIVWAMELRPELQSEVFKAEMDAIAVNLALSRRFPTVLLGADYGVVGPRFPLKQNNWSATIAIQFPLTYDFWTQYRQKSAEQRQGSLQRVELQDQVRLEVRRAYEKFAFWQSEWPKRQKEWGKA